MSHQRPSHWRHDRDFFFKYTSVAAARAILQMRKLKWSPASTFNDPFDMQFDLHVEFDEGNLLNTCKSDFTEIVLGAREFDSEIGLGSLLSSIRNAASRIPVAVLDGFIDDSLKLTIQNIPRDMTAMHAHLRAHFSKYKVLCLSARNDSILMWSHYADHHRGAVLQFSCLEEPDSSWSIAEPIVYSERMPRFVEEQELRDLITGRAKPNNDLIVKRTIFSKAKDWEYENEWRVYLPSANSDVEFMSFNPPELTGIYFGCRSSETERNELLSLAKEINPSLSAFHAKKSEREFFLKFDKL